MPKKNKITLSYNTSIRDTVKEMDLKKLNSIVITNNKKKVMGIFTMGDFRRAIFFGLDIENKISTIINKNYKYLIKGFSKQDANKIFVNDKSIFDIPVLNKKHQLLEIISRSSFFSRKKLLRNNINFNKFPVVIMAGGKGTRLDPFTRILPKPLIPFGDKPIIRVIMDNFINFGSKNFYITVNDKSNMIKAYFSDYKNQYNVSFVEEKKPLGTAGSLKLLTSKLKSAFFLTNSDVQIFCHYPSIINFHKKNKNDLTLISSMRNYVVPYGVCNFHKDGTLENINEKPKYNFFVNTGLYLIEPKILKLIPNKVKFDINQLIVKSKKKGMKIGTFPVSENSWIDIGQWSEYNKNIQKFNI